MINKLNEDILDNKWSYILIFLLPFLVYFSEFATFPMTMDELRRHGDVSVDIGWVQQGRWGMYILTKLYSSNPVFPFIGIYSSSIISCVSLRLFIKVFFKEARSADIILFCFIFTSYPILYFFYSFSTISFSLGFVYLFSIISVILFFNEGVINSFLSSLFLVISLSIYQASIGVFICLFSIVIFSKALDNKHILKYVFSGVVLLILSLFLYYLTVDLFIELLNTKNSGYVNTFNHFEFSYYFFKNIIISFFCNFLSLYGFSKSVFVVNNLPLCALVIFSPFAILFSRAKFALVLAFAAIVFSPLLLNVLSISGVPKRTLIALPLSISFLVFCTLYLVKNSKVKNSIRALSIIAIFFNIVSVTKLTFIDSNSWSSDKMLATLMINRVYSLKNLDEVISNNDGKIPVHLIGYKVREENQYFSPRENIGRSFFYWGNNELLNISNLFSSLGFGEFQFADLKVVRKHLDEVRSMGFWPDKSSVKVIENIVYIKISDYTEAQNRLLCNSQLFKEYSYPKSCFIFYNPLSIPFSIFKSNNSVGKILFSIGHDSGETIVNGTYSRDSGTLVVKPISDDVQIIFPEIKTFKEKLIFNISAFYSQDDVVEIYLYSNEVENYTYDRVVKIKVNKGFNDYSLVLPAGIFKNKLRVDLTTSINSINNVKLEVAEFNEH
jgi:hypothetical protein